MKIIVLDSMKMRNIFEGHDDALLQKLTLMENNIVITTSMSSFMNAILISTPNIVIKNIQTIMKITKIQIDDIDYKNHNLVQKKLLEFASNSKGI